MRQDLRSLKNTVPNYTGGQIQMSFIINALTVGKEFVEVKVRSCANIRDTREDGF